MTMTDERLAELDAVMAKATAGEWAYKPQDYDDWGAIRAAPESEGRSYIVAVSRGNGQQDHKVHRELGTDPYEPNGRAIVALHNAYPDLKALIDAQAATITRLTSLMMDVDGISDAINESFDVDWSSRDGARHVVGYFETEIARAALAGAA